MLGMGGVMAPAPICVDRCLAMWCSAVSDSGQLSTTCLEDREPAVPAGLHRIGDDTFNLYPSPRHRVCERRSSARLSAFFHDRAWMSEVVLGDSTVMRGPRHALLSEAARHRPARHTFPRRTTLVCFPFCTSTHLYEGTGTEKIELPRPGCADASDHLHVRG